MDHVTPICTVHISKKKTSMAGDRIIKKEDRKIPKLTGKKIGCVVFFLWLGFPIFVLWACRRLWLMISDVVSIYFPLVSHISQQISPHYHGFHHFFRLNMSFMLALAFIHFFLPVFLGISKEILYSTMHFGGWIWAATLLGWFCGSYFLTFLFFL